MTDAPDRYRIANETSGGTVLFRGARFASGGWTPSLADALEFETLADARINLRAIEASGRRAGRRYVMAEIDTDAGPAHREVTEQDRD